MKIRKKTPDQLSEFDAELAEMLSEEDGETVSQITHIAVVGQHEGFHIVGVDYLGYADKRIGGCHLDEIESGVSYAFTYEPSTEVWVSDEVDFPSLRQEIEEYIKSERGQYGKTVKFYRYIESLGAGADFGGDIESHLVKVAKEIAERCGREFAGVIYSP